ncbi:MAG: hypothetical protein Q4A58_01955 [Fusobacterium sp.]|uniref:hypothetical protein n=1 Tax=Fusobacterium sp. TaxID=68766 RepID=UPI0026DAF1E3|nr:hypothetical protein [Fusobacterium sp.]MDO4690050.1 hypothetical protein [Fusobacterium sp.]
MGKNEKKVDIVVAVFNNESLINDIFENLKKELLEFIFMEDVSTFKKAIFIQGIFSYANLILSANQTLSEEDKNKKMIELINISKMLNETSNEDLTKFMS